MKNLEILRTIWLLILSAGLVISTGCFPSQEAGSDDHPTEEDHSREVYELTQQMMELGDIRIEESRQLELRAVLEATGVVSQNETRVAHIRPLSRGVIEKVHVRRGDRVQSRQPLVLYDNIELGELIGEYLSLQARLRKDLAQLEVGLKFWERGVQLLEFRALRAPPRRRRTQ